MRLYDSFDCLQPMRMLIPLLIKYTRLVQVVNAHLPRAVDDLLVAHDDAHMGDVSVLLAEESEVTGLGLLQEIHQFTFLNLLRCIAWQSQSCKLGAHLHQT